MNWKKVIAAALLAGGISLVPHGALAATEAELLVAGDTAYAAKDYQQAYQAYNEAVKMNAKLTAAYLGRGRALCWQGNHKEALADFAQAMKLEPENVLVYAYRSQVYENMKQYELEKVDLQRALELAPGELVLYVNMIRTQQNLQQKDEAVAVADKLLELYRRKRYECRLVPEISHQMLGGVLMTVASVYANCSQPDREKTLQVIDLSLQEFPKNPFAYFLRAAQLGKLQRYEEGLAECDQSQQLAIAQQMEEILPMQQLLRAGIHYDMKDYPAALQQTELILQVAEDWKDVHLLRYNILRDMGEKAKAEAEAKRFLELGGAAAELE